MIPISRSAIAALLAFTLIGGSASAASNNASINRQFSAAVARVLEAARNQQQYLRDLSNAEFRSFVSCAQGVMAAAPTARKQYVLAARSTSAMRLRFDEVALDNQAALKQQITLQCS